MMKILSIQALRKTIFDELKIGFGLIIWSLPAVAAFFGIESADWEKMGGWVTLWCDGGGQRNAVKRNWEIQLTETQKYS